MKIPLLFMCITYALIFYITHFNTYVNCPNTIAHKNLLDDVYNEFLLPIFPILAMDLAFLPLNVSL